MNPEPRIRPARPADAPRLLRLLPDLEQRPTQALCYVVESGDGETLEGGAEIVIVPGPGGRLLAGFQFALEDNNRLDVLVPVLLTAMKAEARRRGADELAYQGAVMKDSPLEKHLGEAGFQTRGEETSHYRMNPLSETWDRFERSYRKLKERGRIPDDAVITTLSNVAPTPVLQLIQNTLGSPGPAPQILWRKSEELSVVILEGPVVRGAHLMHREGEGAATSYFAVDPGSRNTWIFTALMTEVRNRLVERGISRWTYKTNPNIHRGILNFARKIGAEITGKEHSFFYPIR